MMVRGGRAAGRPEPRVRPRRVPKYGVKCGTRTRIAPRAPPYPGAVRYPMTRRRDGRASLGARMTQEQKRLVQEGFELVVPIADAAAAIFYARLFELDPAVRRMFKGDMTEQGKKLMQTLTVAVRSLNRLDTIVPAVQALGRRHGGYGVTDQHYVTVGAALL